MYDTLSKRAAEFIDHDEIERTMTYARENRHESALIGAILDKAEAAGGLTHREAALLLECADEVLNERIYALARRIKERIYGNRIVLFAPLYLSNFCVNGCTYCPYHAANRTMLRRQLTQEQIEHEVVALQDMGHKRLALEAGEHPLNSIDYILESIRTIYGIRHRNGAIRRVNVNIAATTVENYRRLADAGIGTYILFQETYHSENYRRLHPYGPKSDYAWHTEAMDRAMEGGIDDVGIGVLFGLSNYLYDFTGLMMHAEHLEAACGVGPHTISVPRICPADDIDPAAFADALPDALFRKIVAVIRIAVPYTGMIISTRESPAMRREVLRLGISQISGGSNTSVGGYDDSDHGEEDTAQFDVSDRRTLDQVVAWLLDLGYVPSFCTACYRLGRTGDRFMSLVKQGRIADCCGPNALLTLSEYLADYASPETRAKGERIIAEQAECVPDVRVRARLREYLGKIGDGGRDFRF